jgi:hypothetical protein
VVRTWAIDLSTPYELKVKGTKYAQTCTSNLLYRAFYRSLARLIHD